jgi:hypothetical protein
MKARRLLASNGFAHSALTILPEPDPMLVVGGTLGLKTKGASKRPVARRGNRPVQDGIALGSFKPAVERAARTGETAGLASAARKSFAGRVPRPSRGSHPDAAGAAPGRREDRSSQIAVNEVDRRQGTFGRPGKASLKEDDRIGPKIEAAFAETAKCGGADTLLDQIGRSFGLFG